MIGTLLVFCVLGVVINSRSLNPRGKFRVVDLDAYRELLIFLPIVFQKFASFSHSEELRGEKGKDRQSPKSRNIT
jgi:hypothetical protein